MDFIVLNAILFLGVIPALVFLFIGLKGYEGHYKDKTIFLTFVVGIAIGTIGAIVLFFTFGGFEGIVLFIILLAFFDQLIKTIVLNIGRFQKKKETCIYGLSLGLGFGSAFTPATITVMISNEITDTHTLTLLAIGTFGIILFHGATGAYIGYGVYIGRLTKYLFTAIMVEIPFNFIMSMLLIYSNPLSSNIQIGFVIGTIIFGIVIFFYVVRNIMPRILPQSGRRKRLKKRNST